VGVEYNNPVSREITEDQPSVSPQLSSQASSAVEPVEAAGPFFDTSVNAYVFVTTSPLSWGLFLVLLDGHPEAQRLDVQASLLVPPVIPVGQGQAAKDGLKMPPGNHDADHPTGEEDVEGLNADSLSLHDCFLC
jgi:hypothetical protein